MKDSEGERDMGKYRHIQRRGVYCQNIFNEKMILQKFGQSFRIVTRRTNSRSNNNSSVLRILIYYYFYLSPREARPLPNAINRALQPITVP